MSHWDSHCHWDAPAFDSDRPAVAERARAAGITALVVPGVTCADWERPLPESGGLAVRRAAGLHPAFGHPPDALERLERALAGGGFVAIGETGLDHRFARLEASSEFESQLALAERFGLPLILHVVKAHEEVLAALRRRPGLRGVVHAFAGSWTLAQRYLELGFKLGLGGIATWPSAAKLHRSVQRCPVGSFMLETDAPDLAPEWARGRRNEPGELARIAHSVAELRQESPEAVLAASDRAITELFGKAP